MPFSKKSRRYFLTLVLIVTGCVLLWTTHQARFAQQPDGLTPERDTHTPSGPVAMLAPTASTNRSAPARETNRLDHSGIDGFSAWARQFQTAATLSAEASVVVQGEALAKNRRSELVELIQADPKQALAAAVP